MNPGTSTPTLAMQTIRKAIHRAFAVSTKYTADTVTAPRAFRFANGREVVVNTQDGKPYLEVTLNSVSQDVEEVLERIAQEAASELAVPGEGWQPIETAPKDESDVLLGVWCKVPFAPDDVEPVFRYSIGRWTTFNGGGWVAHLPKRPTHWLPLPAAPGEAA